MPDLFYNRVLLVVVLYKQNISQSLTLMSLNEELVLLGIRMDVFIYDNSPDKQYDQNNFQWNNFDIFYVHDASNPGLSKAYNRGATKAEELEKEWLLLLDQDTTFPKEYLKENRDQVIAYPDTSLFVPLLKLKNGVLFSPCINKHKRGYPAGQLAPGKYNLWKYSPVNSGMLIRLSLFKAAGGYNEKVKIDFCDFQFLEKVREFKDDFHVINATGLQDFSAFDYSPEKQQARFTQYLEDAFNCEKPQFTDKLGFLYTVTRHALGLTVKLRSLKFIGLYIKNYLIR